MSEATITTQQRKLRYTGHFGQVLIYLGKLLRMFVYESEWKVMPMAALIAGIVSMVVRKDYFLTMEGTLKGAFALTCVAIWNGCFNSIQVVCRERDIIKREHRSGLHISAYILSHMIYQAILCLLQTAITLFVCARTGIQFPSKGLITPWLIVDLGITIFLISYASDMLSLWVSSITRSTTTAMTVMPFLLIFQLVFSGGLFNLPEWANKLSAVSISNYGFKCIAAQSDYNNLPLVTAWNSLVKVENQEINTEVTLGQAMDFLQDDSKSLVRDLRDIEITLPSEQDLLGLLTALDGDSEGISPLQLISGLAGVSLPELPSAGTEEITGEMAEVDDEKTVITTGEIIDVVADFPTVQESRDKSYKLSTTVGQIMDLVGREKLKTYIQEQTAASNYNPAYENSRSNIRYYWIHIFYFIIGCAALSVISLEFVDKDKR